MTRIIADISVSLDVFVTGPDPSPDDGLGTVEALHTWACPGDPDRRFLRAGTARSGAAGRPDAVTAAHAGAAEHDPGIERDAPDLRRLRVIR